MLGILWDMTPDQIYDLTSFHGINKVPYQCQIVDVATIELLQQIMPGKGTNLILSHSYGLPMWVDDKSFANLAYSGHSIISDESISYELGRRIRSDFTIEEANEAAELYRAGEVHALETHDTDVPEVPTAEHEEHLRLKALWEEEMFQIFDSLGRQSHQYKAEVHDRLAGQIGLLDDDDAPDIFDDSDESALGGMFD